MRLSTAVGFAAIAISLVSSASATVIAGQVDRRSVAPPANFQRVRSGGAVSLAEFRQLQAEVQALKQQMARFGQRLDAINGRTGGRPPGPVRLPGHTPGCPQCP